MSELWEGAKVIGPWAALALFLVWQLLIDKKRLVKVAEEDKRRYAELAQRSIMAMENHAKSTKLLAFAVKRLAREWKGRPCWWKHEEAQKAKAKGE